jgi:ornithine decarboxylase
MDQVLSTGATPGSILYAHPCKSSNDIHIANEKHVPLTVVDSPEEVIKLATGGWKGGTLIRLMVPDSGSVQPFSKKFGAPISWVPEIRAVLKASGIKHCGYSFHVGSMCTQPLQFSQAIELCAQAARGAREEPEIIDIGGGFLPNAILFEQAAKEITSTQGLFSHDTKWIAEPGRFLCAPVVHLEVLVTGVKRRMDVSGHETGWRYTVDESIYGAFSNIPFDAQKPHFQLLSKDADSRPTVQATLFGRTCDSADCLAEDISIPELCVGDRLRIEDMGAYTLVSASEFNGFPNPHRSYEEKENLRIE